MAFNPAQKDFVESKATFPAFVGGLGSGKTAAAMARIIRLKRMCPGQDVAYYLPSYGLIEDIAYKRFPEIFERLEIPYKLNKQTARIKLEIGSIVFRTMAAPERIIGYEVAHSICDEIDTLTQKKAFDVWVRVIARNRQKAFSASGMRIKNTVAVATTPEGFRFVWDRWVNHKKDGYEIYKAKTSDNLHNLPSDYVDNLKSTYPDALLSAYLDGEFVNLTAGSVYAEFARDLNASSEIILAGEALHIGMDFNVAHGAAVVHVLRGDNPHAVAELTDVFDTPAMILLIKRDFPGHQINIYPDASGQNRKSNNASESDLSLLRAAGFKVCVNKSNPAVKDRVLSVNRMIKVNNERRYKVNPEKCPQLVQSLERQAYDKNGEPDKTAGFDHILDAMGYFIVYRYPIKTRPTLYSGNIIMPSNY